MYIAIDIGGSKTLIAAYSDEGEILRSEKHKTEKQFTDFIRTLNDKVDAVCDGEYPVSIAVAVPGLVDYETGVTKRFGNRDWKDVDVVTPLKEHFRVDVYIDNDANMGALGEANMGAGQGYEKVLYVTLSTGIGTGITMGGKLSPALRESEGGMMKFKHDGHLMEWEDFASGKAFVETYGQYGADDDNPEDWKAWSEDVSVGMVDMISLVQPDVVVIGGSMGNHIAKYHDFLHAAVQEKRGATVEMPALVGAKYSDDAVINGCYVTCKQHKQN